MLISNFANDMLDLSDIERMVKKSNREQLAVERGFFRVVDGEKVANLRAQRRARKKAARQLPKFQRTKRIYWPNWPPAHESPDEVQWEDANGTLRDKFFREVGPNSELAKMLEDKGFREFEPPYNTWYPSAD